MSVHSVRTVIGGEEFVVRTNHNGKPAGAAPEARDLAIRIAEILAETPASATIVLDIQNLAPFADFFVICSGDNDRQLRAISREISETLSQEGVRPERVEGTPFSGWILLDYGATIVHVFNVHQRAYYRLEEIWSEAPTLLAIQ